MNLALDFGNTRVKVAAFQEGKLSRKAVFPLGKEDETLAFIQSIHPERIIFSAVSQVSEKFRKEIMEVSSTKVLELEYNTPLPVKNFYNSISTLGKDRIALACGVWGLYPGENSVIADAGTCITYDFIDMNGTYHGGAISPGMDMRFRALNKFTHSLPRLKGTDKFEFIGRETKDSILSGVLNGVLFEVEGFINKYSHLYRGINVIITGGDAEFFVNNLNCRIFAHPDLVLIGLNNILNFNNEV